MIFAKIFDFISLVLSQLFTVFGFVRFTSMDELANERNPARFMRWGERKRLVNQFNGGFLLDGKIGRFSKKTSFQSIITTGGMGVGKSSCLVIPNILTADNCSLVITDTSGEIYEATSGYLEKQGYDIKVLNLMDLSSSHGYNPLRCINSYTEAELVANTIIDAGDKGNGDPIWSNGAKRLLRILIRALKNREPEEQASLVDVHHWLNNFDGHSETSELDSFMAESCIGDDATLQDYMGFVNGSPEKMMLSFVSTAATALSAVGNPEIHGLLKGDDFDFAQLKEKKTAVYILVGQADMAQFRFLLSLFFTHLCKELLKDRQGSLPVYLFLDEFGHLKISGFETFATTARKYQVGFWLFLQSLSQLTERYGENGAQTILGGLGTETYFGGTGLETAQNLSQRLGTAFKLDWLQPSAGLKSGELMRPDEIIRLKDSQMLVLHSNRDPIKINTLPYNKRGDLRKAAKLPPAGFNFVEKH